MCVCVSLGQGPQPPVSALLWSQCLINSGSRNHGLYNSLFKPRVTFHFLIEAVELYAEFHVLMFGFLMQTQTNDLK